MNTVQALTAEKCSINAKEGNWCAFYSHKCAINCEYAINLKLTQYSKNEINSEFDDEYNPDSDDSDECCEECGCYHGHNSWCSESCEDNDF